MKQAIWKVYPRTEDNLFNQLLKNRGVNPSEAEEFLHPHFSQLSPPTNLVGVKKASDRIKQAIANNEKIIIYGDYDVDGVTATAVLWETINKLGGKVMPYIPDRFTEGYGVSAEAIKKLAEEGNKLIISVDTGVTAMEEVQLAKSLGIDFIITDHHTLPSEIPAAYALVHSTDLAGVGVAYKLAQTLIEKPSLDFVALGTIADVIPLLGENRVLAKLGLEELRRTTRPGLMAMCEEASIDKSKIGTYEVGFLIGPRLNASGRLEHALNSLRILLTTSVPRAHELAKILGNLNKERLRRTLLMLDHARTAVPDYSKHKLWVISDSSYEQGVIGLVAGRLANLWSRPVLVIAEGSVVSKGSARSIDGFNIVEAISHTKDLLISYGGHHQAAGFTIETKNIGQFRKILEEYAQTQVKESELKPTLHIDAEIKKEELNLDIVKKIAELEPFGPGNEQPLFIAKNLSVGDMRLLSENKHLKLELSGIDAIGFGLGPRANEIRPGMSIAAVFNLEENTWKGNSKLQLKLRDFLVKS